MSAYLKSLQQSVPAPTQVENDVDDLKTRVQKWFDGLPAFTRQRAYSIRELEVALERPGCLLSPALLALGWQRKRRWRSRAHYHRYWMPPPAAPADVGDPSTSS